MKKMDLNGAWQLAYNNIGERQNELTEWFAATVPGDVHLDMVAAGIIPEPLVGENTGKIKWMEEKQWWYKKCFILDQPFIQDRLELACEGLDLTTDIWINGCKAGFSNNMFITHRFDITPHVRVGENEILVRLDNGFKSVEGKPIEPYSRSWNAFDLRRVWMRKAQQAFSWDHAPRVATCGIWRDIYLESFQTAAIRDVFVHSAHQDGTAVVHAEVEIEVLNSSPVSDLRVDITLSDSDNEVLRTTSQPVLALSGGTVTSVAMKLEFDHPRLWWPNGMGEAHLYKVKIELLDSESHRIGCKSIKHGIRNFSILQEDLGDQGKSFTFVVNGVKTFCKGANWVPSDAIYARATAEKNRSLVKMAQQANMNILRIWGGGIYENEAFYSSCDEYGIMVWQDFMFACAYYPDNDPAFCEEVEHESRAIIRRLRNHTSLVIWCGNNENQQMYYSVKEEPPFFYGEKIYNDILPGVLGALDPTRPYWPSSPYGGKNPNSMHEGDQHIWLYSFPIGDDNPYALKFWNYVEKNPKFLSEFGILSPANLSSVAKYMGEHPMERGSEVWKYHTNHFDTDYINKALDLYYKDHRNLKLEEFTLAGQMIQAEVLKFIIETLRGRMFVCSGGIVWVFSDCWGTNGWTIVDYYLSLKPSYYYLRRAFEPLHAVFEEQAPRIRIVNDTLENRQISIEYGVMTFLGEELISRAARIAVEQSGNIHIDSLEADLVGIANPQSAFVYVKVYEDGKLVDRNRQFLTSFKELKLPFPKPAYSLRKTDHQEWELTLQSNVFMWMVALDSEGMELSDNFFDLWPGEEKKITIRTEKDLEKENPVLNSMSHYKHTHYEAKA